MQTLLFILSCLSVLLLVVGAIVVSNYRELKNRPRMDHRVMSFRRPSERGHTCSDFLRAIAEGCCILLLLASVLGWWFYSGH
jgi:hypothetical protein